MRPDSGYRPLPGVLKVMIGVWLAATPATLAASQRLVHPGATIRIGDASAEQSGEWRRATVIRATSREFLVEMSDADETMLLINESTRLQILRGRTSPGYYTAAVGAVLGGLIGALAFEEGFRFGANQDFNSRAQAGLVFGVLEAAAGWIVKHHKLKENQ